MNDQINHMLDRFNMTEPVGCNFAAENQRYYSSKFWSYDYLHSYWLFRLAFGSRRWRFNWQKSWRLIWEVEVGRKKHCFSCNYYFEKCYFCKSKPNNHYL